MIYINEYDEEVKFIQITRFTTPSSICFDDNIVRWVGITFAQCWTNVEDVWTTLYECYTNVLCLLGRVNV